MPPLLHSSPPTHTPNTPQHHIHPVPSQTLCGLPCFVSLWKETITHTGFLGLRDIVLTVYRNCIPLKFETEDFTRIKTKQKTKKRLFYYTSVSILTFWEIFFLFGELQHILFAEVSLQWKKKDKNHTYTHTHILDSYHKGIIDCMLLSITVLFFFCCLFLFLSLILL